MHIYSSIAHACGGLWGFLNIFGLCGSGLLCISKRCKNCVSGSPAFCGSGLLIKRSKTLQMQLFLLTGCYKTLKTLSRCIKTMRKLKRCVADLKRPYTWKIPTQPHKHKSKLEKLIGNRRSDKECSQESRLKRLLSATLTSVSLHTALVCSRRQCRQSRYLYIYIYIYFFF